MNLYLIDTANVRVAKGQTKGLKKLFLYYFTFILFYFFVILFL